MGRCAFPRSSTILAAFAGIVATAEVGAVNARARTVLAAVPLDDAATLGRHGGVPSAVKFALPAPSAV